MVSIKKKSHPTLLSNLCRFFWQLNITISLIYLDTAYKKLQRKYQLNSLCGNHDLLHLFVHWWRKVIHENVHMLECLTEIKQVKAAVTYQRGGFSAYNTEVGWIWSSWSSRIVLERKIWFRLCAYLLLNIWFLSSTVRMLIKGNNERTGVNDKHLHLMKRLSQP